MKSLSNTIEQLRTDYLKDVLDEAHLAADPESQFAIWFEQALKAEVTEPNAVTLGTANAEGRPTVRIVLLRGFDSEGFTFYTNYESRKGMDMAANAQAALNFFWPELQRQVRIDGRVVKVSEAESDAYFDTRPRGSQLGAWASRQSTVLASREELEEAVAREAKRFDGKLVRRPPYWGGYRLIHETVEFWQGRESRLHDRMQFRREAGSWIIERLSP